MERESLFTKGSLLILIVSIQLVLNKMFYHLEMFNFPVMGVSIFMLTGLIFAIFGTINKDSELSLFLVIVNFALLLFFEFSYAQSLFITIYRTM